MSGKTFFSFFFIPRYVLGTVLPGQMLLWKLWRRQLLAFSKLEMDLGLLTSSHVLWTVVAAQLEWVEPQLRFRIQPMKKVIRIKIKSNRLSRAGTETTIAFIYTTIGENIKNLMLLDILVTLVTNASLISMNINLSEKVAWYYPNHTQSFAEKLSVFHWWFRFRWRRSAPLDWVC